MHGHFPEHYWPISSGRADIDEVARRACASTTADHAPTSVGGLPGDTSTRQTPPSAYPAVNDLPPPRSDTLLSSEEQMKLQDELAQARNRTAGGASADPAAAGKGSASK